jgi:cell pole-organizing protein PopZ
MPEPEHSPRDARRLRDFGRRRVPDDAFAASPTGPFAESIPPPPASPLAAGSIWGPQVTPGSDRRDTPERDGSARTSKHRRRTGERPPDPDSVAIDTDDDHAWWAQRDDLDRVVNPKKRGAAARAQRAAREAFAPAGSRPAAAAGAQQTSHNAWDPASVYNWATTASSEPQHDSEQRARFAPPFDSVPPAAAACEPTPWDVLGLTSEATWSDVSRRHKQLAKEHHPDRHANDAGAVKVRAEARMAEINAAFSDLRRIYRLTDGT